MSVFIDFDLFQNSIYIIFTLHTRLRNTTNHQDSPCILGSGTLPITRITTLFSFGQRMTPSQPLAVSSPIFSTASVTSQMSSHGIVAPLSPSSHLAAVPDDDDGAGSVTFSPPADLNRIHKREVKNKRKFYTCRNGSRIAMSYRLDGR